MPQDSGRSDMTVVDETLAEPDALAEVLEAAETGLIPPPWAPDCWSEQDQSELVCRRVLDITHDVKSFLFEPVGPRVFRFEPGQFITLQLEVDGQHISRCYTLSSPPTRPHLVAITVKRVVGGP